MEKSKSEKYDELIQAVETEYMGKSKHETALRYIKEKETLPRVLADDPIMKPTQSKILRMYEDQISKDMANGNYGFVLGVMQRSNDDDKSL